MNELSFYSNPTVEYYNKINLYVIKENRVYTYLESMSKYITWREKSLISNIQNTS